MVALSGAAALLASGVVRTVEIEGAQRGGRADRDRLAFRHCLRDGAVGPVAIALAERLGVDPRPFLVAVMLAASAAFATPFGYQINALVLQMLGYN